MKLDAYRHAATLMTSEHCDTPGETMRNWARSWRDIFLVLLEGQAGPDGSPIGRGIFEPCSLIVARWEFLGCLLTGHQDRSNRKQSKAYAERFLRKINPRYGVAHPAIATHLTVSDLLVQMLRNGSLHGFTPSGVYDESCDGCISWALAYTLPEGLHLHFVDGRLHVDGSQLATELHHSMWQFAAHLDENKPEPDGRTPRELFRDGYRSRLAPMTPNGRRAPWAF